MAIALVKAGTVAIATSASSVTPTFGQTTTAGNLLVACLIGGFIGSVSPTGWALAVTESAHGPDAQIWYKPNCGAGETAPTFSAAPGTNFDAVLSEWSGAATNSPLDQTGSTTAPAVSASLADTNASNCAIVAAGWTGSKSATATITNSWTPALGSVVTIGDNSATKGTQWLMASGYLLNGHGGGSADTDTLSMTPSTGLIVSNSYAIATFLPFVAVAYAPHQPRAMQAVNRAATFFSGLDDKLPWRKRTRGGLFIPDLVTV